MLLAMGGAMSTAELGISLAEMIRRGKVHAICCTGANLEEDVFNLVAHTHYERVPALSRPDARRRAGAARPAPEPRHRHLHPRAGGHAPHRAHRPRGVARGGRAAGERFFPHEFLYRVLRSESLEPALRDRSEGQLAARGRRWPTCRSSSPAGRIPRWATSSPRTVSVDASSRCIPCGRASST